MLFLVHELFNVKNYSLPKRNHEISKISRKIDS